MANQVFYLRVSGVLGALAVILGAFGAHGLEDRLSEEMLDIYVTGVTYHFYHVMPILALSVGLSSLWTSRWTLWACRSFTLGIAVFSGSLYLLALTETRWLGAITPIGGTAMIAGWICLAIAASRIRGCDTT